MSRIRIELDEYHLHTMRAALRAWRADMRCCAKSDAPGYLQDEAVEAVNACDAALNATDWWEAHKRGFLTYLEA